MGGTSCWHPRTGYRKPTNSSFKVPLTLYAKAYGPARLWHQTGSFDVCSPTFEIRLSGRFLSETASLGNLTAFDRAELRRLIETEGEHLMARGSAQIAHRSLLKAFKDCLLL
jgi:hypothetical protein